jgi:putative endonuclease
MHYCYILYSLTYNKFYIGETENIEERLIQHNNHHFPNSYTKIATDWELFLLIECESRAHARNVERFIKSMKNRLFIHSLKDNREKLESIILKYRG